MKSLWVAGAMLALSLAGCFSPGSDVCADIEADVVIKMMPSNAFSPDDASVSLGEDGEATVAWCNVGGGHNVRSADGSIVTDVSSQKGLHHTETFTADDVGTYEYWCVPHRSQGMTGTLRITE